MKNLILVFCLISGLVGCGGTGNNDIVNYRAEMEKYIDSVSDDFSSYEFANYSMDSVTELSLLSSSIDSSKDDKGEYKGYVFRRMALMRDMYQFCKESKYTDCEFETTEYVDILGECNRVKLQIDSIKNGLLKDSLYTYLYWINYRIKNDKNAKVKRHCVFVYSHSEKAITNKRIEDGWW